MGPHHQEGMTHLLDHLMDRMVRDLPEDRDHPEERGLQGVVDRGLPGLLVGRGLQEEVVAVDQGDRLDHQRGEEEEDEEDVEDVEEEAS